MYRIYICTDIIPSYVQNLYMYIYCTEFVYVQNLHMYICTYIYMYRIYICTELYIYKYIYIYIYIVLTLIYIYIYIYICTEFIPSSVHVDTLRICMRPQAPIHKGRRLRLPPILCGGFAVVDVPRME